MTENIFIFLLLGVIFTLYALIITYLNPLPVSFGPHQ